MTKTALITGASSGIGYASAIEFAKRGYTVFAGARRLEPMKPLEQYGVIILKLDVSSLESIAEAKALIESKGITKLDVLYNNAGQSCSFPALDATDAAIRQCYDVNVFGAMNVTREFSPLVINAKGTIGFTGSVSALLPFPWSSTYSSTKAAIHSYAATLRLEMRPFDVKVINIVTGGVKTNIEDTRPLPPNSLYNVEPMVGKEGALALRQQMARRNNPLSAEEYARRVANDFESGSKLNYYRGKSATLLYYVSYLIPLFIIEWAFSNKFRLWVVFAAVRNKQKSIEEKKLV